MSKAVRKLIDSIFKAWDGQVGEFLQEYDEKILGRAAMSESKVIKTFKGICIHGAWFFTEKT